MSFGYTHQLRVNGALVAEIDCTIELDSDGSISEIYVWCYEAKRNVKLSAEFPLEIRSQIMEALAENDAFSEEVRSVSGRCLPEDDKPYLQSEFI